MAIKNFYYSDSSRSSDSGQSYSIDFKYPAGEALRIEEGFWGGLGRRTLNGIKSVIRSENQVQQKKLENAAHIQMDNGLNLYISPDEKVYAKTISDGVVALVPDSVKSQYSSQISAVREWKDSILQGHKDAKTVSITYLDNNLGKTKQEKRFCVERKDPYLIVHLDSPVSGDGACK